MKCTTASSTTANAAFSLLRDRPTRRPGVRGQQFLQGLGDDRLAAWAGSIYPDGLAPEFEKLIQFNTSGGQAFLQHGAIAALREGEEFVQYFVDRCRHGHAVVNDRLARMPRIRNIPNNGSFYAMFEVDGVMDTLPSASAR